MTKLTYFKNAKQLMEKILQKIEITMDELFEDNQIQEVNTKDIAVIGIGLQTSLSDDKDEFWKNTAGGIDCIRHIPEKRKKELEKALNIIRNPFCEEEIMEGTSKYIEAAYLEDIDTFDANFFRITPSEATLMDPCQRVLLESIYHCIEDAGYVNKIKGSQTGVYIGFSADAKINYFQIISQVSPESVPTAVPGNLSSILASRISYILDLRGPALQIDTACSSSLVAIHTACKSILIGDCDQAIVGGVRIQLFSLNSKIRMGIESSDFRTKSFDDRSDGTGSGEGAGAVFLKPFYKAIQDKDQIYAVIKGSAINQDGLSTGITAPNQRAQTEVIIKAWKDANVTPESITYIEAHGTGTRLGDPIEVEAITKAFRKFTEKRSFCGLGSVKSNIGHLYEASGIFGFIKSALSLNYKKLPPILHFKKLNQQINLVDSPLYIVDQLTDWETDGSPRRCGVTAFGFSGTNCHVVLEENTQKKNRLNSAPPYAVLTFSARSFQSLSRLLQRHKDMLLDHPEINTIDVCYTRSVGRGHFEQRLAIIVNTSENLHEQISRVNLPLHESNSTAFFGEHKVIPDDREIKKEIEIHESLMEKISEEAQELLSVIKKSGLNDLVKIQALCQLYIRGASVNWDRWFDMYDVHTVTLPVYPFDKKKYWIELPELSAPISLLEGHLYYSVNWKAKPLQTEDERLVIQDSILIFLDETGLGKKLSNELKISGKKVIEVSLGSEFTKNGDDHFTINLTEECLKKLFSYLEIQSFSMIIHMMSIKKQKGYSTLESIGKSQEVGVKSLYYLHKLLQNIQNGKKIELVVISELIYEITKNEKILIPENAPMFKTAEIMGIESDNIMVRCIDIDNLTKVNTLLSEIERVKTVRFISYRDNVRYVEELNRFDVNCLPGKTLFIKKDGVYVITGGLGGIGLEVCKFLASQCEGVKLALFNRSQFPLRDQWDTIIQDGTDEKNIHKIKKVKELEFLKATVLIYQVDVGSLEDVNFAFKQIREKHGKIIGIVHSAGIPGESLLKDKTEEMISNVLKPKIIGTQILDRLTENDNLDFFVVFSSIATVLCMAGQGDYAAANAYLDAFAYERNRRGKKTTAINWVSWKETGMAFKEGLNFDNIFKAITNAEGIMAFRTAIEKELTKVIIGELNIKSGMIKMLQKSEILLGDIISDLFVKKNISQPSAVRIPAKEFRLLGRENGDYTVYETEIALIWQEILGFNEMNIFDNFFDLGGDSLIAIRMTNLMSKKFNLEISIGDVLNYQTIFDIAVFIESLTGTLLEKCDNLILEPSAALEYYPLSSAQKRIFVLEQMESGSINYNIPRALVINEKICHDKLKSAIQSLCDRHESLRTSFVYKDGRMLQKIHPSAAISFEFTEAKEEDLDNIARKFVKPFDLSQAPLVRFCCIQLSSDKSLLLYDIHHIIADLRSIDIIEYEFNQIYFGKALPVVDLQYKDFAVWQNKLLHSEKLKKQKLYWQSIFDGELPVLELPTDLQRPALQSFEGDSLILDLDPEIVMALKELSKQKNATLSSILLTVYNILLYNYTHQEDIIVGMPLVGRFDEKLQNIVGMFVSTIAIRSKLNKNITFSTFLDEIKNDVLNAFENQDYPFDDLINVLDLPRDLSRNPLFSTMFTYQTDRFEKVDDALQAQKIYLKNRIAKFDLTMSCLEVNGHIYVEFEYCTKLFFKETIERMKNHFKILVRQVIQHPETAIGQYEMISDEEKLVIETLCQSAKIEINSTVVDLFESVTAQEKDCIAIISENTSVSYSELHTKANQIAHTLIDKGAQPGDFISILMDRSADLVASIFGIWKAGCAYVSIDPDYPSERISFILKDTNTKFLLIDRIDKTEKIGDYYSVIKAGDCYESQNRKSFIKINCKDLAYIIYTSGSTGKPKGALIDHCAIMSMFESWKKAYLNELEKVRLIQTCSFSFDVSVADILRSILTGGTMVMASARNSTDPIVLVDMINKYQINLFDTTPAVLVPFLDIVYEKKLTISSLKIVITASDTVALEDFKRISERFETKFRILNSYGVTEATIDSCYYDHNIMQTRNSKNTPIGKPYYYTDLFVLGPSLKMLPIGIAGELCIAGPGLARGYLNRPELTTEKFVENPYKSGQKLYRTGDSVKLLPNGCLEFLGRIDNQLKVRGYRIEIAEIENAINENALIKEACVIGKKTASGDTQLCAAVVPVEESDAKNLTQEIVKYLKEKLPDYMVPVNYKILKELPLTHNKKIDKKTLLKIFSQTVQDWKIVEPRNEKDAYLLKEVITVLKLKQAGMSDNFFLLGGSSLSAISLVSKLQQNYVVNLNAIFEYPVLSDLSDHLIARQENLKTILDQLPILIEQRNQLAGKFANLPELLKEKKIYQKTAQKIADQITLKTRHNEKILLTGATGYLGAYLLRDLLIDTDSQVVAIVRADSDEKARQRLAEISETYFEDNLTDKYCARLTIIHGDLTQKNLGMTNDDYLSLARSVNSIFHAAAKVSHYGFKEDFEKNNILSVQTLLDFANTGIKKDIHHISTISVATNQINCKEWVLYHEEQTDIGQKHQNEYNRTKLESEKLLLEARKSGINVSIYRIGALFYDSETGKFQKNKNENALYSLMKSFAELGFVCDIPYPLEVTYVNTMSRIVIGLFKNQDLNNQTYHLINPHGFDMMEYLSCEQSGLGLNRLPLQAFSAMLLEKYPQVQWSNQIEKIILNLNEALSELKGSGYVEIAADKTYAILNKLGLEWDRLTPEDLVRFLKE